MRAHSISQHFEGSYRSAIVRNSHSYSIPAMHQYHDGVNYTWDGIFQLKYSLVPMAYFSSVYSTWPGITPVNSKWAKRGIMNHSQHKYDKKNILTEMAIKWVEYTTWALITVMQTTLKLYKNVLRTQVITPWYFKCLCSTPHSICTQFSYMLLMLCGGCLLKDNCDIFTHILQGYFTGTGAIIRLPQCKWSNPEG